MPRLTHLALNPDAWHHVVWNHVVGKLWDRTKVRVRRAIGATGKSGLRIRYAKVAEYQRRGVVHLHALVRLDGYDPNNPEAILQPPMLIGPNGEVMPMISAHELAQTIEAVAADSALRTQAHAANPDGWLITWGHKGIDAKPVRNGLPGGELTEQHVAGYLAKYATKATEITGVATNRVPAKPLKRMNIRLVIPTGLSPPAGNSAETRNGSACAAGHTDSASAATSPQSHAATAPPSAP